MPKSKEITDFIEANLSELRPGEPVPSDVHLYFKSNQHILLWQPAGTMFTQESIERYRSRGIEKIWIHKSDWEAFHQYLHPRPIDEPPVRKQVLSQELVYKPIVTARQIVEIIRDPAKDEREKRALVAKVSRSLLGELASPDTVARQRPVNHAVSRVVRDMLNSLCPEPRELTQQLWNVASTDPATNHGVSVASMATLFALAFGKIDESLLTDIGMAALLHDVGITQIPYQIGQIPWESLTPEQLYQLHDHVTEGCKLITSFAPEVPERVKILIQHHHESYSDTRSTGPAAEIAQLISMADIINAYCSGLWDGEERTVLEALAALEQREEKDGKDRRFNAEVFAAILRWTRRNVSEEAVNRISFVMGVSLNNSRKTG